MSILDAPPSIRSVTGLVASLRNAGFSIAATNPCMFASVVQVTGTGLTTAYATEVVRHIATADASEIALLYANYCQINSAEMNPGFNDLNVAAAIQRFGTNQSDKTQAIVPLFFPGGCRRAVVAPGGLALSNSGFLQVAAGESFYSRTHLAFAYPAGPTSAPTATPSNTGGTLVTSGAYGVVITAVYPDGTESLASAAATTTIAGGSNTGSIVVTSPTAIAGAIGYRAYLSGRGAAINSSTLYQTNSDITPFGTDCTIIRESSLTSFRLVRSAQAVYKPAGPNTAGGTNFQGLNSGEGVASGDATMTGGPSVGEGPRTNVYWPVAVLGRTRQYVKTVALVGDSIQAGTGDGGFPSGAGGFGVRALMNQLNTKLDYTVPPLYGYVKVALGGEKLQQFANATDSIRIERSRHEISTLATNVICNYGTNDLADGVAVMKAALVVLANWYTSRGIKFYQTTVVPKTNSTDAWRTTTNQTVQATEATRLAFNQWLRDTSSSGFVQQTNANGLVAVMDICKYVEVNSSNVLTQDGGLWIVPPATTYKSGTFTSVASNVQFSDNSVAMTANAYKGRVIVVTSGAANNKAGVLDYNNTTDFNTGSSIGVTPAIGDSYVVMDTPTTDGTHPSPYTHILMAQAAQEKLSTLL